MSWARDVPALGLLRTRAQEAPETVLVTDGVNELSYYHADMLTNTLADVLATTFGVKPGDRVLCLSTNGPSFLLMMVAVQRLGAVFVPVTARRGTNRLVQIAKACTPTLITATTTKFGLDQIDLVIQYSADRTAPYCDLLDPRTAKHYLVKPSRDPTAGRWPKSESSTAMLLYTSGSTGSAKGIVINYTNQRTAVSSITQYLCLKPNTRILSNLPPAFDYGLYQYYIAIAVGGTIAVYPESPFLDDWIEHLSNPLVSVLPVVPTAVRRLRRHMAGHNREYPHIKTITSTGSALDRASIYFLQERFPNARIFSMYGLSECKRVSYLDPDLLEAKPESVGRPMPNCEVFILDERGRPVASTAVGELFVSGPNVAVGYWNDPAATDAAFRKRALDGRILLATGDLFSRDADGDLYFHGRRDDIVKIHDQRISLLEVEQLLKRIDGVVDAIAGLEYERGEQILVASLLALPPVTSDVVSRAMRAIAPSAAHVPRKIYLLDELPETDTGKISRHKHPTTNQIGA
ncbi:Nonribosomal peptide synthetase [Micromonospora saelicesensis]|uniref:class I adenylate-forming enzyme family protein n=1 Tax=Micromonospora saelicesensis TaxID=285676 RepID=UPI000DBF8854|nr:class I adenylate-forming enzyme family protein [Micromonospora saelicesensis]RAO58693.1 Nonribosomal peptide synthetase [Micromonospora saelicesensis]